MVSVLRQRLVAVVDDLSRFVIGDLLKIPVVIPINNPCSVHEFAPTVGIARHSDILNKRFLFARAPCLHPNAITHHQSFSKKNMVAPLGAPTVGAGNPVVGGVLPCVDLGTALTAFDRVTRVRGRHVHFRLFEGGRWARALPAALLDALAVRPSRSTELAAVAALAEVTFAGALVCARALPPDVFARPPVDFERSVAEAARAAWPLVTFGFDIRLHLHLRVMTGSTVCSRFMRVNHNILCQARANDTIVLSLGPPRASSAAPHPALS